MFIEKKHTGGVEEIQKLHMMTRSLINCLIVVKGLMTLKEVMVDVRLVVIQSLFFVNHVMEVAKYTMKVIMKKMIIVRLVGECGFQRYSHCNENGLIRISMCCF